MFKDNCGIDEPSDKAEISSWETHLINSFVKGLRPDIKRETAKSCVGIFDGARLTEVLCDTKQAEKVKQ